MRRNMDIALAVWLCPHFQAVYAARPENPLRLVVSKLSILDMGLRLHQRTLADVKE